MPGLGFSGVANGAFTTTGKGSDVCGINAGSTSGGGVGGTGVTSTFVTAPSTIGQAFGGGYYAGQISTAGNGVADYYLIVSPAASGQTTAIWKVNSSSTAGTSSDIDGPANSAAMNNVSHPAAYFCEGLSIGGYTDWYLPAKNELEVIYYNLKPTTQSNYTSSGINPNSVPPRTSNYTAGNPAQTSAADFKSGGAEALTISYRYWASTQYSSAYAWTEYFTFGGFNNSPGLINYASKYIQAFGTRAIRRVPV